MGVKNISDLVSKEMHCLHKTKSLTKKQINEYKVIERDIYKKFGDLSEDELNAKNNKNINVKN